MTFNNAALERAFQRSIANNQFYPLFPGAEYSGINGTEPLKPSVSPNAVEPSVSKIYIEHIPVFINGSNSSVSNKPKISIGRVITFSILLILIWRAYMALTHSPTAKPQRDISYYMRLAELEVNK